MTTHELPWDFVKKHGGYWGEHPEYLLVDWRYEVANDDTRQGYWLWVSHKLNSDFCEEESKKRRHDNDNA